MNSFLSVRGSKHQTLLPILEKQQKLRIFQSIQQKYWHKIIGLILPLSHSILLENKERRISSPHHSSSLGAGRYRNSPPTFYLFAVMATIFDRAATHSPHTTAKVHAPGLAGSEV